MNGSLALKFTAPTSTSIFAVTSAIVRSSGKAPRMAMAGSSHLLSIRASAYKPIRVQSPSPGADTVVTFAFERRWSKRSSAVSFPCR